MNLLVLGQSEKMNLIVIDTDKFKLSNEVGEMSSKSEKSIKKM